MMAGNGFKDITGQRFGRLIVIERDYNYPFEHNLARKTNAYWKCKCDCGNIITVRGTNLRNGKTKSCGCLSKEKAAQRFSEMNRKNALQLQGKTFGYLTALYPLEERKHGAIQYGIVSANVEIPMMLEVMLQFLAILLVVVV